jgi:hypothetical protein
MEPMALPAVWMTFPHTAVGAPPVSEPPPPPPPPRFWRTAEKASCRAVDAADAALPSASFTRSSTCTKAGESTQRATEKCVTVVCGRDVQRQITTVWVSSSFLL